MKAVYRMTQPNQENSKRMEANMKRSTPLFFILLTLILTGCSLQPVYQGAYSSQIRPKDNKPEIWITNHPRVKHFRDYYLKTITVKDGLERGRRYLGPIAREFQSRGLPLELIYLPLLESRYINRADSGHAKGIWQFIPSTAKAMGLRVGFMVDERMNWRKATIAAAEYLLILGKRFNYNWALALAAYNGGPNYVEEAMRKQGSWNFWDLNLREETQEYVPRFIAMLQVARERYPHMLVASR